MIAEQGAGVYVRADENPGTGVGASGTHQPLAAAEAPAAEEPRIHLPLLVAPDRILFTRAGLDSGVEHSALFVMNGDGSTVRQLTTSQLWVSQAVWSPQGNQILFASREASSITLTGALNVMNADGSGSKVLMQEGVLAANRPTWSPGGDKVALPIFRTAKGLW